MSTGGKPIQNAQPPFSDIFELSQNDILFHHCVTHLLQHASQNMLELYSNKHKLQHNRQRTKKRFSDQTLFHTFAINSHYFQKFPSLCRSCVLHVQYTTQPHPIPEVTFQVLRLKMPKSAYTADCVSPFARRVNPWIQHNWTRKQLRTFCGSLSALHPKPC